MTHKDAIISIFVRRDVLENKVETSTKSISQDV